VRAIPAMYILEVSTLRCYRCNLEASANMMLQGDLPLILQRTSQSFKTQTALREFQTVSSVSPPVSTPLLSGHPAWMSISKHQIYVEDNKCNAYMVTFGKFTCL